MTTREPLPATPRKAMTPARRGRVLMRQGWVCAYPGCEVKTGLEIDHQIALELGGKESDENLVGLCADHHKAKTRLDLKLIARARRRREKHAIRKGSDAEPRTKYLPSRQINNRPFPQGSRSLRHPTLKRTMSGQVVPR